MSKDNNIETIHDIITDRKVKTKREYFKRYQKRALLLLEHRVLNDLLHSKYDKPVESKPQQQLYDLMYPLIDKMTLAQVKQSYQLINAMVVLINQYAKDVESLNNSNNFHSLKAYNSVGEEVIEKPKDREDRLKEIDSLLKEIAMCDFRKELLTGFSPPTLIKELEGYKRYLKRPKKFRLNGKYQGLKTSSKYGTIGRKQG